MLQGFILAFSMYSRFPMPKIRQNKNNMKYAIAFFPFVGLMIAAFLGIWLYFAPIFHFSRFFISCIALILPYLLTGNIHFYGFLHTEDSLASNQGKEEKLNALKNSHISAPSCVSAIIYFLFSFAVWNELYPFFAGNTENDMTIICLLMLVYIISRCLGGLSILTLPNTEKTGTGPALLDDTRRKFSKVILLLILFICCVFGFFLQPMLSPLLLTISVIFFFLFRIIVMKHFGGITNELMGWFLQNCELILLTVFLLECKFYY